MVGLLKGEVRMCWFNRSRSRFVLYYSFYIRHAAAVYGISSSLGFFFVRQTTMTTAGDELAGVLARVTLFSNYYTNLYLFKIDDDR